MTRTESFGRGRIVESILDTTSVPFTLKISKVPVEDNQFITINPDTTSEEIFFYTTRVWTAGEAWTINITNRWYNVNNDTQLVGNQREHDENSEYKLALNHIIINDKLDKSTDNVLTADIQFTWTDTIWLNGLNNLTTVQRDLLTPNNGALIYNTDTNVNQQFLAWAWSDVGNTGTPDASETVAGKIEMATQTQYDNKTLTWETGAFLVPQMDQLPITATEAVEWLVERATDTEAQTWTDTTRFINSKQLGDSRKVAILQTTRGILAATSTEPIPHGLWVTPRWCSVKVRFISVTGSSIHTLTSDWFSDWTVNKSTGVFSFDAGSSTNNNTFNNSSKAIFIQSADSSSNPWDVQEATITFDATNINIVWVDAWSGDGPWTWTLQVTILVHS